MTTRSLPIDDTKYWKITDKAQFLVQNTGNGFTQIVVSDTQPADNANGINLKEDEAITDRHVTGTIWAKGNTTLVVTDG
jgi:hypothetical protein